MGTPSDERTDDGDSGCSSQAVAVNATVSTTDRSRSNFMGLSFGTRFEDCENVQSGTGSRKVNEGGGGGIK